MKLIERISALTIFSSALLLAQSASASIQLTYTSNPLHFKQGYLADYPDESVGSEDGPTPYINFVFGDIAATAGTHALPDHALVKVVDWSYLFDDIPITGGSITLNESGIPTAWNFSLEITKSTPGYSIGEDTPSNDYKLPTKEKWWFESSYGANTCNCDKYRFDYDLYIERAYYTWAYANTLGFLFEADNSPNNWVATKVDVPEPSAYMLMLMGLVAVGAARMRKRGVV